MSTFAKIAGDRGSDIGGSVPDSLGHLSQPTSARTSPVAYISAYSTPAPVTDSDAAAQSRSISPSQPPSLQPVLVEDLPDALEPMTWERPQSRSSSSARTRSRPQSQQSNRPQSQQSNRGSTRPASGVSVAPTLSNHSVAHTLSIPMERASTLESERSQHSSKTETSDETSLDVPFESEEQEFVKPPPMRFRNQMQFVERFRTSERMCSSPSSMEPTSPQQLKPFKLVEAANEQMNDMIIGWINTRFQMQITTEFEFVSGFPIIVLTMLDAIYPKRVRWREVNWKLHYKEALDKNYVLLTKMWQDVKMEKAREFRAGITSVRLEQLPGAGMGPKLEFLRQLKHWFDARIKSVDHYNVMASRSAMVASCKIWGKKIVFPYWIKFDDREALVAEEGPSEKLPEYQRLIRFLGSPVEHQTM